MTKLPLLAAATLLIATTACAETAPAPADDLRALAAENAILREKVNLLEKTPALTCDALARKTVTRLRDVAVDVRGQRQAMVDFESYVRWMDTTITGYRKYIEAGSVAAGFARVLPIPYAGQAGMFTKFVSHFALSLNAASASINRYLGTSQQFLARVDALRPDCSRDEVASLVAFADGQLLKDMGDVQQKLATTAELSGSALSFLESLNHYVGNSDEYWQKTKNLLKKDTEKADKGFLAENIQNLRNKAGSFNTRLKTFDDTARKNAPLIKSLAAYQELMREMDGRLAAR